MEERHNNLPDINRLSILAALILSAYATAPLVNTHLQSLSVQVSGILFSYQANFSQAISLLVAALAAAGMSWLIQGHPGLKDKSIIQYIFLPTLTAWVIGIPLNTLTTNLQWWVIFAFGGILLIMVFVAEYISVDISDARQALAAVGLTAVAFALYLFLNIAIKGAGIRLYLSIPALGITLFLVCIRSLYLRLGGRWCFAWSASIAVIIAQFSIGLHYWPLSPLAYGLILLGMAYALTNLAGALEEGRSLQTLWIEPVIMLVLFLTLAALIR